MEAEETELVSLKDALRNQNSTGRPFKTFIGYNTGNQTFTLIMTLFEVQEFTEVANEQSKNTLFVAQRKLDIEHAQRIGKYILKGLLWTVERETPGVAKSAAFDAIKKELGTQPYLSIPPLVASFRKALPDGSNLKIAKLRTGSDGETACYKIFIKPGDTFWIVDGQHRRKGLELVHDFLKYVMTYHKYPKASLYKSVKKDELSAEELRVWTECLDKMNACCVSLEVHLGLDEEKERQLFHDLNNFSKKVDKNLALNFDGSNPINRYTGEVVINDIFDNADFSESNAKDSNDWRTDGFTRQELVSINALLFLNKTNVNGATPSVVDPKKDVASLFWRKVVEIPGITDVGSKQKTVAAQRVVLKALAKLVYDFAFGKFIDKVNLDLILDRIPTLDFSHDNPAWRYYNMDEEEREEAGLNGLENYLPDNDGANRDLGNYDLINKVFRFGSKHNDIYPIIGDIIRWKLSLPSRKKLTENNQLGLI